MRRSTRVLKAKPHRRVSQRSLKQRMSELISLRERLAQAELEANRIPIFLQDHAIPELVFKNPQTERTPSEAD
jgi:hypothetical protein